jgi:GNAT superfamily N-acetyltransferase
MSASRRNKPPLSFHPLTADRWADFETLFGPRGACGGCWCMFWRLKRSEYNTGKGVGNRSAMHALVDGGEVPGILAYADGKAVGWCAVAPREEYPGLGRSRILKPLDDKPVWSVSCLFVAKDFRNCGVSVALLKAAVEHVVEGYPVDSRGKEMPAPFVWHGLASAFRAAGFKECARASPTRPIMRRTLRPARAR